MNKKTIKIGLIITIVAAAAAIILLVFILNKPFSMAQPSISPSATTAASTAAPSASVEQTATATPVPTPVTTPSPSPTPTHSGLKAEDNVKYNDDTITYEYYDPSSDSKKTIEKEVSGEGVLKDALEVVAQQYFKKTLEESPLNPNSIILENNSVYIDFKSDIYKSNFGSPTEGAMLESIANAYLDNIENVNSVYISVNGKDYSSGNAEFPATVPYKTK